MCLKESKKKKKKKLEESQGDFFSVFFEILISTNVRS